MRFMQIESVLQTKNRSEPAKNRFSVALVWWVNHNINDDLDNNQGAWTLSMISNRSVKMTSDYPTSCLEVRRKQKVNKPIFKGSPRKIICKYHYFNHIVFSCSACLQKENCLLDKYAIIVRYAVYKAWSLHKGLLTLQDAIVSHHQNGWIVTFKPWSWLQYYVHKTIYMTRNCKASLCVSCGYSRKIMV